MLQVNAACERFYGLTAQEMQGRRLVAQRAETEALAAHYRVELQLQNSRLQRDEALPACP